MEKYSLMDVIATIPPRFQVMAIQKYIFDICEDGNIEEAERYFERLRAIDDATIQSAKAEIARILSCAYAFQNNFEAALRIYGDFDSLGSEGKILLEKIKAAHVIINMLYQARLTLAYGIWQDFIHYPLSKNLKWHWANDAFTLLIHCRKQSN